MFIIAQNDGVLKYNTNTKKWSVVINECISNEKYRRIGYDPVKKTLFVAGWGYIICIDLGKKKSTTTRVQCKGINNESTLVITHPNLHIVGI